MSPLPANAVLVVIGIPGAGKTTLIRRAVDRERVRVHDSEDRRDRYRERGEEPPASWRMHLLYYARVRNAIVSDGPLVIHTRGTHDRRRRWLVWLCHRHRRPVYLLMLDCSYADALAGQHARGRTLGEAMTRRQYRRWQALVARAHDLPEEGWERVDVYDRAQARAITQIPFTDPPAPPS